MQQRLACKLPRAALSSDAVVLGGCTFLCLKNIRTFLSACLDQFGMKKNELFEAFDLFDVRDFAKVIDALSSLSYTAIAQSRGVSPFPTEDSVPDDEIYSGLSDHIDDTGEEDDDLYDCVDDENNEGDEIYEDLMRHDAPAGTHFMKPLQRFLQPSDIESIFINIEELYQTHSSLLEEVRSSILTFNADNLYQVFIKYKKSDTGEEDDDLYDCVDDENNEGDEIYEDLMRHDAPAGTECSKRANNGRFTLRDLLMVPMQRVLKYHLLLQELVKHTTGATDKDNLRTALDAMRDLAQCVNEVKRDNEILRQITSFQLSIENMTQSLALYGRPKIDGELKICVDKRKQDRYVGTLHTVASKSLQ
ncbi:UNVERIFIED_CONTAM: hypothetical protein FKN15_038125 [Acipenser sinensis]